MKIEIEIQDINREEIVEAMARQLLGRRSSTYDPDTGETSDEFSATKLGFAMKRYLDEQMDKLAKSFVRAQFGEVVNARITATVDAVLAEGWILTDNYGNARGPKVDLKGRISELLTQQTSEGYGKPARSMIDRRVEAHVEELLSKELRAEIEVARKALRDKLDAAVAAKFAEAVRSALGMR